VDLRISVRTLAPADHAVVEDRLVEGHRDLVLSAKADRGIELVRILDPRQAECADDDALVGDPQANRLGELVLGEEIGERLAQRGRVMNLTLAHDTRLERHDRRAPHGTIAPRRHLGRGDAARFDVEPDDGVVLLYRGHRWRLLASSLPSAVTVSCAIPKTDESGLANESVQVGVDELIPRQQAHDAPQRKEGPERHSQLPGPGAATEHDSHPD